MNEIDDILSQDYDHYFLLEESEMHYSFCFLNALKNLLKHNNSSKVYFNDYVNDKTTIVTIDQILNKDRCWIYDEFEELQFTTIEDDKKNWIFYFNGTHDLVIAACQEENLEKFVATFHSCANLKPKERLEAIKSTFNSEELFNQYFDRLKKMYPTIKNGF